MCVLPFLFASCGLVRDWRELESKPMPIGECFDGVAHCATGMRFTPDDSVTDRGFGVWQSRWRQRVKSPVGHPARYRLRVEILVDDGSARTGWPLRFAIDQEWIDDLRRANSPEEQDWSSDGQDRELEAIFGEALRRKLAPQASGSAVLRAKDVAPPGS